jgi:hypothetical protein
MSLAIGILIGVVLGIVPGGNPVLSAWLSDFLPIEGRIASVITTFIVSGVKLSNPQTSGDLNGMLEGEIKEEVDIRRIALERLGYFVISFLFALPIISLRQVIVTPALPALIILGLGIFLYMSPPNNLLVKRDKIHYLIYGFQLLVVAVGSIGMFFLAKEVEIANPIYMVSVAIFFPWERIFRWGYKKTHRPQTDLNEDLNPVDVLAVTGFTFGMGGWNAPLTGYSIDLFSSEEVWEAPKDRIKRSLFVEAIAEGIRLGSVLIGIDRLESRSAITQSIKEGVDITFFDYRLEIVFSVAIASLILFALTKTSFPDIYAQFANTKSSQYIFYGVMMGTVFGTAGVFALPILGIGMVINYLTCPRMLWAKDPKSGNRARSTVFIYPIILL